MKKIFTPFFLFFVPVLFASMVHASCGCASCPIDTHTQEKTEKGIIRLDYSYEYINQDQPRIGRERASVGEISGEHNEVSTLNQMQRIGLDAGLSSRWSLQVLLPFIHREHQHIHDPQGAAELESWNFNGMGDMTLQTRYAFLEPKNESRPRLSALIGGVLPTGRHHATNTDGEEAEAGIQPGKGATSFILGLSSLQIFSAKTANGQFAKLPLFFSTTYQWNGKGDREYRIGNIWLANAGVTYPLLPKVGFMTQINLKVMYQDDAGETDEEVEKTGGTYVYASPGLQLTLSQNVWSYVYVQLPVYQRVNQIQLTSDYNFIAGISYKFSAL